MLLRHTNTLFSFLIEMSRTTLDVFVVFVRRGEKQKKDKEDGTYGVLVVDIRFF